MYKRLQLCTYLKEINNCTSIKDERCHNEAHYMNNNLMQNGNEAKGKVFLCFLVLDFYCRKIKVID